MPAIGIRELHNRTSEVLRQVREAKTGYVVTHRGQPVAVLLPVDAGRVEAEKLGAGKRGAADAWGRYARLVAEVRQRWPHKLRSQDVLDAVRR